MSGIPTSTDVKWDQFVAENHFHVSDPKSPFLAKEFAKFVSRQLQAEFSDQMGKTLLALSLIQTSKTHAEAVGLAKDAALTGHMFGVQEPAPELNFTEAEVREALARLKAGRLDYFDREVSRPFTSLMEDWLKMKALLGDE